MEGYAEEALLPVFAKSCGHDLDELGVTVCSVGGVNFSPYVKLATALALPFAVITDWDPLDGTQPPLGRKRAIDLIDDIQQTIGKGPLEATKSATLEADDDHLREAGTNAGVFLNSSTFELEIADSPALFTALLSILEAENFGTIRRKRLDQWRADPSTINGEQLMAMVADVGKGRLADRLAAKVVGLAPPGYIAAAINHVTANV